MMGDKVVVGHDEGMESYGVYLDKLTWVIAAEHSLSLTGMRGIDPGSIPDTYHIKGPLNLFRGEIDFKIMRDKLHSLNYNLDYYRGQEIWGPAREEGRIRYYTYFALYEEEGYFVVGFPEPVLDSIIALERGYPMLSDKPSNSLTQLIERLGYEEVDVQASDECYFYLDYQGCLSSGSAGTIALLDRTYISLFSNEKHAEAAAQELHDGYIEVTVEGEFVITKFSTPE